MKMDSHTILFLQRLNLIPRGYIILDRTHSFHGISDKFFRKPVETFSLQEILSTRKFDKKASILCCECMETTIHFKKNMLAQPSFYY